jgi:hypothetical protein
VSRAGGGIGGRLQGVARAGKGVFPRGPVPPRARFVALAAVLTAPLWPSTAHARCHTTSCVERVARKQCDQAHVRPCIKRAALHQRVSYPMLVNRAWCESTLNPYAVNGVHAGLFQFRVAFPSTWATVPRRYSRHSPYSAKWASLAAAWMERVGRGGEWACRG